MSTREEAKSRIISAIEANKEWLDRSWYINLSKDKLDAFSDDTLIRIDSLMNDDVLGKAATTRVVSFLGTGQIKNVESVIRNIFIFAEVEHYYTTMFGIRTNKPWKVFKDIEKYAHTLVCGVHNALETDSQAKQMVAVMHAVMAICGNSSKVNGFEDVGVYTVRYTMVKEIDSGKSDEVIEVFKNNPEKAKRLSDFIVSRGVVDAQAVKAFALFGDELPSAMYSGVL